MLCPKCLKEMDDNSREVLFQKNGRVNRVIVYHCPHCNIFFEASPSAIKKHGYTHSDFWKNLPNYQRATSKQIEYANKISKELNIEYIPIFKKQTSDFITKHQKRFFAAQKKSKEETASALGQDVQDLFPGMDIFGPRN